MSEELQSKLDEVSGQVYKTVTFGGFMKQISASVLLALTLHNNPAEMVDKLSEARTETIQRMNKELNNTEV